MVLDVVGRALDRIALGGSVGTVLDELRRLGIQARYRDWQGTWRDAAPAAVAAARAALVRPKEPGPLVIRQAQTPALPEAAEVLLEDGSRASGSGPLPLGYHTVRSRGRERRLIVCPPACPPAPFGWGWAVQLYALRSADSWGMGDLGDLARLAAWAAGQGAAMLLVNPLHASRPGLPQEPSPYYPSSRSFRNPLYLRIDGEPPAGLNESVLIDRDRI